MTRKRLSLLLFFLSALAVVIIQCTQIEEKVDSRGSDYAGSASCQKCHGDLSESYVHNAHFNTSALVEGPGMIDSLRLPESEFIFNAQTKVGVEKRNGALYQVAYIDGKEVKAEKIDVIFGSGKSAYTFGFWFGNKLMQMPLNYLPKEHVWVNSPGFPEDQIYFGRPIIARCLECHGSAVTKEIIQTPQLTTEEEFVKGSLIAGVDCERCHGPAATHVRFHEDNPKEKEPHDMVRIKSLPLSRRIDMCAVCHSGIGLQTLTSTFDFKPGDTLKSLPQFNQYNGGTPDVHGNQKQLLEASPCFKIGKAECLSCHDVHETSKPTLAVYSKKCISCHQGLDHPSIAGKSEAVLASNCVDCHMPVKDSGTIGFQLSNSKEKLPYRVRTHQIGVYEQLVSQK